MVLLITYDLNAPGKNYNNLYEEIKKLGATWWHYLDSTWLVDTFLSPQQVWECLSKQIDRNDRVLVVRLTNSPSYSGWLTQDAWDWLNARIY